MTLLFTPFSGVTNNIVCQYNAFRTFTFSMQQCIVYMTKKISIILINFKFQIGNNRQSKRLLANLGRILFFSFFFWDKNRNTGFSSRHLLRLQKCCMNSRFWTGIFWIQWYRFDFAFILGNDHFTCRGEGGGYGFFLKKIFWFPMLLKKIFWFWWRKNKNNLIRSFCHIT
jgi:hypothetical protein